ncbi:SRPBCC family protein [Sandarakinorhabdus oryzae]|uniref:SRPBCC family protein n=1 Tax=Sandarakinorhabdus oryzae TaxID=2675220 RepID=UPI0012E21E89|nr:SRPBCC domain-containing protein [Sandarakinorhabdus oryzae]
MTFAIVHDLAIRTRPDVVFAAVSTPAGLDSWWTETCSGLAQPDAVYALGFGGDFQWQAKVVSLAPGTSITFEMTDAADDWLGTTISFRLEPAGDAQTILHFRHEGWAEQSDHFRGSSYCWAMYLRLLRLYCETGTVTPYDDRYFA